MHEDPAVPRNNRRSGNPPALADRLKDLATKRQHANPALYDAYERMIDRLDATVDSVPTVGDRMPGFLLPDDQGRLVGLDDLLKDGALVLSMNRGHWCPYCRTELSNFAELEPEIGRLGASILSITPERQSWAARLKSENQIRFPVLCDIDNAYALSLGLMFWIGNDVRRHYLDAGIDLSQFQGNDGWFLPIPATFVVSREGIVVARFVEPDFRKRMPVDRIFQALTGDP